MTRDDAKARVARGAALLDTVWPGWVGNVNTDALDMYSPCGCVLGQLLGDFNAHAERFLRAAAQRGTCSADYLTAVKECGFHAQANEGVDLQADYRTLQDAWIEAIADRLLPTSAAGIAVDARLTPVAEGTAIGSATESLAS